MINRATKAQWAELKRKWSKFDDGDKGANDSWKSVRKQLKRRLIDQRRALNVLADA